MHLTIDFCREQAALQLAKAAREPSENRQKILIGAAEAWSTQALLLEKRSTAQESLDKLDAEIALEFANDDLTSLDDSE